MLDQQDNNISVRLPRFIRGCTSGASFEPFCYKDCAAPPLLNGTNGKYAWGMKKNLQGAIFHQDLFNLKCLISLVVRTSNI